MLGGNKCGSDFSLVLENSINLHFSEFETSLMQVDKSV